MEEISNAPQILYLVLLSASDCVQGEDFPFDSCEFSTLMTKAEFCSNLRYFQDLPGATAKVENFSRLLDAKYLSRNIQYSVEVSVDRIWPDFTHANLIAKQTLNQISLGSQEGATSYINSFRKGVLNLESLDILELDKKMISNILKR